MEDSHNHQYHHSQYDDDHEIAYALLSGEHHGDYDHAYGHGHQADHHRDHGHYADYDEDHEMELALLSGDYQDHQDHYDHYEHSTVDQKPRRRRGQRRNDAHFDYYDYEALNHDPQVHLDPLIEDSFGELQHDILEDAHDDHYYANETPFYIHSFYIDDTDPYDDID